MIIDTETIGLGGPPFAVCLLDAGGKVVLFHQSTPDWTRRVTWPTDVCQRIRQLVDQDNVLVFHNAKYDVQALRRIGIGVPWQKVEDTMLLAHAVDSQMTVALKPLAELCLGFPQDDLRQLSDAVRRARRIAASQGIQLADNPAEDWWMVKPLLGTDELKTYNVNDCRRTLQLWLYLHRIANDQQRRAYWQQLRLLPVLDRMEQWGVTIRPAVLERRIAALERTIQRLSSQVEQLAGQPLNLNSPVQVAGLLERFGVRSPYTTATGRSSVSEEALQEMFATYTSGKRRQLLQLLLEHRAATKACGMLKEYQRLLRIDDGIARLYPAYHPVGTATTRLSSSHPNVQNIPLDQRSVFGPAPGRVWVGADYSQLELRVMATLAGETRMLDAFASGEDIHNRTAQLCGIDRSQAKSVNYAMVYGAGNRRLETLSGRQDIKQVFFRAYPNLASWLRRIADQAAQDGCVTTAGGYPLRVPQDRTYVAANYMVQGSAGDVLKRAMLMLHVALPDSCRLVLSIHDELVVDVPDCRKTIVYVKRLLRGAMVDAGKGLGFDTPVDVSIYRKGWR